MSSPYFALIITEETEIAGLKRVSLPNDNFGYYCNDLHAFKTAMKSLRMNIRRYCMLYLDEEKKVRQGTVKATKGKFEYGRQDEIFVPLGSDGMPLSNATMVTRKDGAQSGEYEMVQDAIDLALQRYGIPISSPALKELFI